jgi:hypothetical protein
MSAIAGKTYVLKLEGSQVKNINVNLYIGVSKHAFFQLQSMEKAKRFFDNYPQSQYRDKLVNEIIDWCKHEETEEGYKLALEALPKNHLRYKEVVAYYEKHFVNKK